MSHFDQDYFDRLEKRRAGDPDYETPAPAPQRQHELARSTMGQTIMLVLAGLGALAVIVGIVWLISLA
jgi:hypothetical protein